MSVVWTYSSEERSCVVSPPACHLTPADAAKLTGRWVRLRVELESLPEARDGFVVFDCTSSDSARRTIWFAPSEIGGDDADVKPEGDGCKLEVIGRLAIVEHPPSRFGPTYF